MRVRVQTDNGNCNIAAAEDPGFFAKWTFLENGALPRPRLPPADSVAIPIQPQCKYHSPRNYVA